MGDVKKRGPGWGWGVEGGRGRRKQRREVVVTGVDEPRGGGGLGGGGGVVGRITERKCTERGGGVEQ